MSVPPEQSLVLQTFALHQSLSLGLDNFFPEFSDFGILHHHVIKDFHCIALIAEIFDDTMVKDPEVRKKDLELSRPRTNLGWKQNVDLQNFILESHPTLCQ